MLSIEGVPISQVNKKDEFESLVSYFSDAPVEFAGVRKPATPAGRRAIKSNRSKATKISRRSFDNDIDDEVVLEALRHSKRLITNNPSLFCGDPNGFFTYGDPILANIAYLYQLDRLRPSLVGLAGDGFISKRDFWEWARTGVHMWLSRNAKSYNRLMGMTPLKPIKINKDVLRIAVTGDAGFKGPVQKKVLSLIRSHHQANPFDLIIHLGDVYFAGSSKEFLRNFLAPFRSVGPRVVTLIGNHDLYFGADTVLDAMDVLRQPGRYFCIENPHWRIACLDTSLPAESIRRNTGRLDKGQLRWLESLLTARNQKRTILMSHHFIVSGWESPSTELKEQLEPYLKKIFAWYWGHEHCCAVYEKRTVGINGACIGNGGFLETWEPPKRRELVGWFTERRCSCHRDGSAFWPHGYLELELKPTRLTEKYHLEAGESYKRVLRRRL